MICTTPESETRLEISGLKDRVTELEDFVRKFRYLQEGCPRPSCMECGESVVTKKNDDPLPDEYYYETYCPAINCDNIIRGFGNTIEESSHSFKKFQITSVRL